jgi:hypothetical protein
MQTADDQGKHHRTSDVGLPSHTQQPPSWEYPMDPLTVAPHWALCPLDWHAHAIDAGADHPLGIWIARCGHRLSGGTPLHDIPQGRRCPSCARWSPTTGARQ